MSPAVARWTIALRGALDSIAPLCAAPLQFNLGICAAWIGIRCPPRLTEPRFRIDRARIA
jgi:hypothetical protein